MTLSTSTTTVHIRKDSLKFSAAHMTVFPDGSKERLHGHNYQIEVSATLNASMKPLMPFSDFKKAIQQICSRWDEKVLLPNESPFLEVIRKNELEIEFTLCSKRYVLPLEEVELLPCDNVTSENLARLACQQVRSFLAERNQLESITKLSVKIEESPGQGASSSVSIENDH